MKDFLLYIFAIVALLFVACTGNEDVEGEQQGAVLDIPIAVCESSTPSLSEVVSRATTGDPGLDENLPAPKFLYVWIVEGDRVWYKKYNTDESDWTAMKDEPERWDYTTFKFELPKGVSFNNGTKIQVYAIAAQHELPDTGFDAITTEGGLSGLSALILDLAGWQNANAAAHSWALGNLYSTPLALMGNGNSDAVPPYIKNDQLQNGTYTVRKVGLNISLAENRPTRLYHCAAKADFKWEVASTLQPTVSVQSITLTGLPTQLRVFEPTHNPTTSLTPCILLKASDAVNPLTPGNKWIGREYAYVLQPPTTTSDSDGIIHYNVAFSGGHTTVTTQTPAATNPVFTTWYRVNANI